MDATEVTNEQFAKFVKATGYVTVAERTPRAEDFPAPRRRISSPGAVVFTPPDHAVPLNNHFQWWSYVRGANWRHPEGPESNLDGPETISRSCRSRTTTRWRMPRGRASVCRPKRSGSSPLAAASSGKMYPWGDEFMPDGHWMANTHQGHFPDQRQG